MTILKIEHAGLIVDSDHFLFAVVGGATVALGKIEPHLIKTMAHCDARARRQFADAQQPIDGKVPGPGGLYPAGSQGR